MEKANNFGSVELIDTEGKEFKVNGHRLKMYYDRATVRMVKVLHLLPCSSS